VIRDNCIVTKIVCSPLYFDYYCFHILPPLEQNLDLNFLEISTLTSGHFGGEKNFFSLLGAELQFLGHAASSIFTRLTVRQPWLF